MMMTGPILVAMSWLIRPSTGFLANSFGRRTPSNHRAFSRRRFASSSSSGATIDAAVQSGVSRIETLQILLSKHGAPGSIGCTEPEDLVPIMLFRTDSTPELLDSLSGEKELLDLHPHLFPIMKSASTGNYVCALRRAYADDASFESSTDAPWPLVETQIGAPGMRLLSLNSEHLMRRIACESDFQQRDDNAVKIYNEDLGSGAVKDSSLDTPYEPGSVDKLGYGLEKYVLLRVGPFPDLYETMALNHAERKDEASSLIAAETANGKFPGFGSTFLFYSQLLASFPQREDEARDAARMCLRLPVPSIGMTLEDLKKAAVLGQLADKHDSVKVAVEKLSEMYEKIRNSEQDDPATASQNRTPEQEAIEEANYLLDRTALTDRNWRAIRPKLAEIYSAAGKDEMARFVDPSKNA